MPPKNLLAGSPAELVDAVLQQWNVAEFEQESIEML
jgi:hypothetical protein